MSDWHRLGMIGLRLAYQTGQTHPVAFAGHMFDRIYRLNPKLNAYIELDRDRALQSAHEAMARVAQDAALPLDGIAIAVAADLAVSKLDASAGLAARRGLVCERDAGIVDRLRRAGAIILGTLIMDEARAGLATDNPWAGRCFNPHCEGASPGGGSGGAAVAVASGLCSVAFAGDTLGALRVPAALCGVFAFRCTPGSLPLDGLVPVSRAFDNVALAARSIDDINAVVTALAPPDLSRAMQRCRFATLNDEFLAGLLPEISAHFDYALSLLHSPPQRIALPVGLARLRSAARLHAMRDLAALLVELGDERCARLSPVICGRIERALAQPDIARAEDVQMMRMAGKALRDAAHGDTIIITPACPQLAPMHGTDIGQEQQDFALLADLSGLPTIVIPAGRTSGNLPIGLQLMGPQGSEAMVIAQAKMLHERLRGYAAPTQCW